MSDHGTRERGAKGEAVQVPLLVNDFLHRAVRLYPDKIAVVDGEQRYSYDAFGQRVNRLANALAQLGIRKGDRVGIVSPNSHFFLESFYGTSLLGAILVPINYRLKPAEHEYILEHAGVQVLLADWEHTGELDALRPQLPGVTHWIAARDEGDGDGKGEGKDHTPDGWQDWNELIQQASTAAPDTPEIDENDAVSINYTSGTTARPKGVMLTHRNCYLNAYNMIAHASLRHDDVELWTLPMFHCNGWGGVYALTAMGGTHVVLRAIDGRRIFELIERERVTFACMAPAVLRTILDFPNKNSSGNEEFRIETRPRFMVAGAPPPAAFIERLEQELGFEFIQIYGLTETAPILTVSQPDHYTEVDDWNRRSHAGVAAIGVEVRVLDDSDQPVPKDGESVGEICARSNVIFAGYWEQPEQTEAAIRNGWFHTGDLAVWDETQSIHIVDRKKDVIISGGENVSSSEIEDVLYQHPAVLECAVIGVPSEKWGETPKALVVLRSGNVPGQDEIIAHCRERMAHFKCPSSVEFVDSLPRTATGKLQKFRLRDKYWKGSERKVG
ncbi:MAG: long-chain-fatty-acid--CoA ligase [Deltaproteobacteria bacterium]|nr:long-chain-fatty-acid--CoA ligase [Deltaproteobacteria bacterium]